MAQLPGLHFQCHIAFDMYWHVGTLNRFAILGVKEVFDLPDPHVYDNLSGNQRQCLVILMAEMAWSFQNVDGQPQFVEYICNIH